MVQFVEGGSSCILAEKRAQVKPKSKREAIGRSWSWWFSQKMKIGVRPVGTANTPQVESDCPLLGLARNEVLRGGLRGAFGATRRDNAQLCSASSPLFDHVAMSRPPQNDGGQGAGIRICVPR